MKWGVIRYCGVSCMVRIFLVVIDEVFVRCSFS